jgi:NADH dehydrogenase FAD-containing subunit
MMAKRVVVVGGGFAGSFIAKQLVKHSDLVDVTLIDTKEFFEHIPAVMREIVTYAVNDGKEDNEVPSTVLEHSAYLHPKGRLIVGEVVDVSTYDVTVNVIKNGLVGNDIGNVVEACSVPYDYLCVSLLHDKMEISD